MKIKYVSHRMTITTVKNRCWDAMSKYMLNHPLNDDRTWDYYFYIEEQIKTPVENNINQIAFMSGVRQHNMSV